MSVYGDVAPYRARHAIYAHGVLARVSCACPRAIAYVSGADVRAALRSVCIRLFRAQH